MALEIVKAEETERPVLERLVQLYLHDLSEYVDVEMGPEAQLSDPYSPLYWQDDRRTPYLIRIGGRCAGFALVRQLEHEAGETVNEIAELFVARPYRKLGIGEESARMVFDANPGVWQVMVLDQNTIGLAFWKKVVWRYTAGQFRETRLADWHGPVYMFRAPGPRPSPGIPDPVPVRPLPLPEV